MVIKYLNKKGQEFEIDCGEDEILLHAGLRNGVVLPYECSTGTCGSCKALAKPGTVNVNEKDLVSQGDKIGTIGMTGRATGPHLHWGVYLENTSVDPEVLLNFKLF